MRLLRAVSSFQRAVAITVCATLSLAHTSQGSCEQPLDVPSVNCAQLLIELTQAKQLLADLREGMASLRAEQNEYSAKLDYFWDISLERDLTSAELEEEARFSKLWADLQKQITLLSEDITNQANLVDVLERENSKYWTKLAFKKPTLTRVREPLT
jgi:hypothetical protein